MAAPTRRLILAAAAAALLAACDRPGGGAARPSFKGVDITGADYAKELNLLDADGKPRTLADFKGKVTVIFFGYTQCPDVCPTTLAELAAARQLLGSDGARVQGVFVTVDPERDSAEILKAYVGSFGNDLVALRGSLDHTAGSYVLDAAGRVRLFTRYGVGPEALAADLKILLAEPAA
jgi:protein SCO1/2